MNARLLGSIHPLKLGRKLYLKMMERVFNVDIAYQVLGKDVDFVKNLLTKKPYTISNQLAINMVKRYQFNADILKLMFRNIGCHIASHILITDRIFIWDMIRQDSEMAKLLEFVGEPIISDFEIISYCLSNNLINLQHVGKSLFSNYVFIEKIIEKDGLNLKYVTDPLILSNEDVVMKAVQKNGCAIKYASFEIQSRNNDIRMEAVKNNGKALMYIHLSNEEQYLPSEKKIILKAVENDGLVFKRLLGTCLVNEKTIAMTALKQNVKVFKWFPPQFRSNPEIIKQVVIEKMPSLFKHVVGANINNEVLIKQVHEQWPQVVKHIHKSYLIAL